MLNSLSKRERMIAIVVAAAVGLFVFDRFALTPYSEARTQVLDELDRTTKDLANADRLFDQRKSLTKSWTAAGNGGIKANRSLAESQAQQAVLDWARSAGVNVASLKPERDQQQNGLQVISFHVNCTGSMLGLSKLLYSLETAPIPIRLNDLQITPRREGTDDLTLQMGVSTLAILADTAKPEGTVTR